MRKRKRTKIFRSGSQMYSIYNTETDISIQIQANHKIEAEEAFTLPHLKYLSIYFCLFQSVESVYDDLISLSKANKITIDDKSESYYLTLNINMKEVNTITLTISKKIDSSQPKTVIEQFPIQAINSRFDKLDIILNVLNARFDVEAVIKQQSELLNMLVNSKLNAKNNVSSYNTHLLFNDKILKISQFQFVISNKKKDNNKFAYNNVLQFHNVINEISNNNNQHIKVFPTEEDKAMISN